MVKTLDLSGLEPSGEEGLEYVTSATVEEVAEEFFKRVDLNKSNPCMNCGEEAKYVKVGVLQSHGLIGLISEIHPECGKQFQRSTWTHYDDNKGKDFKEAVTGLFDAMEDGEQIVGEL